MRLGDTDPVPEGAPLRETVCGIETLVVRLGEVEAVVLCDPVPERNPVGVCPDTEVA